MEKFRLKIYRGTPGKQYWETFEFDLRPGMNVITSLMDIQRNPVNIKGETVQPVVWEDGCLEEVCGSCSMLINGYPRQSCSAVIEPIIKETGSHEITLAPFTKFPLIRDLMVDRTQLFENFKKVSAWVEAEDTMGKNPAPRKSPNLQKVRYALSACMACACCSEGCPQVNKHSKFMGPAAISQARLFNAQPGDPLKAKRNHALMGEDGINACGQAQNCVRVCPKKIPLTDSIAAMYRDTTKQALKDLFSFPDREED